MIEQFYVRLVTLAGDIKLGMDCTLIIARDEESEGGRFYFQIQCYRKDVITGIHGYGYGGKAYLSPHMTDSELVQIAFGLYKGYWEHEARETFQWRERRVFGPHLDVSALWEIALRTDARSAQHVEDKS